MKDREKSKKQLVAELAGLRRRFASLKVAETKREQAEEELQKERQLLRMSLNLHERERKLVAYEIHDGLTQQLAAALLEFEVFSRQRDENPKEAQQTFNEAIRLVNDAMGEARRLIAGLQPPILDESGIVPALDELIYEAKHRGGPEIEFVHEIQLDRLTPPLETAVFRIVQEAMANACRHSRSKKVRVQLARKNGDLRVEVQDWGTGFDPKKVKQNRFGLQGIRERARMLGGLATIDTAPGKGTRIVAELPLSGETSH